MKENSDALEKCLNCGRLETVIPLVPVRYSGDHAWICSQCLPILIHKPQELAGKLQGAENLVPFQADEH